MTVSHWDNYGTPPDNESPRMATTTTTTMMMMNRTSTSVSAPTTRAATTNNDNATTTNRMTTSSVSHISSSTTSSISFSFNCRNSPTTAATKTTIFPSHGGAVGTNTMTVSAVANTITTVCPTNRYERHPYCKENVQYMTPYHERKNIPDVVDLTQSPSLSPPITAAARSVAAITQSTQPQQLHSSSKICNPYQKKITPTHSYAAINSVKRPLDAALKTMDTTTSTTATTTTTAKVTKAFIGGAEMARKKARHDLFDHWKKIKKNGNGQLQTNRTTKGPPTRILRPGETKESIQKEHQQKQQQSKNYPHQNKLQQHLFHTYKNPWERFFHAVLHWPITDYMDAATATASNHHRHTKTLQHYETNHPPPADYILWEKMCHCLKLDVPNYTPNSNDNNEEMIQPKYPDLVSHCNIRTVALLEEVRNTICDSLQRVLSSIPFQNHSNGGNQRSSISNKYTTSHSSPTHLIQMNVHAISMEECAPNKKKSNSYQPYQNDNSHTSVQSNYKIMVRSSQPFTKRELYNIRPGSVFLIRPRSQPATSSPSESVSTTTTSMTLGVVTTGNREMVETINKFEIMIFNHFDMFASRIVSANDSTSYDVISKMFTVTYVTQLVTEHRCFEALNADYPIHFEAQLIGHPEQLVQLPSPTHTRFKYDSDDEFGDNGKSNLVKVSSTKAENKDIYDENTVQNGDVTNCNEYFNIPKLNKKQDDVATQFLQSPPNTITLVQGPPGTGKTTLLVSILCRYLVKSILTTTPSVDEKRPTSHGIDPSFSHKKCQGRIMVCAPTNKAVHVLASRFMKAATQQQSPSNCTDASFNIILVGDADKILMDDHSSNCSRQKSNDTGSVHRSSKAAATTKVQLCADESALRSVYLYTWMPSVIAGYEKILAYFSPKYTGTGTIMTLLQLSKQLQQRLTSSLPNLPPDIVQHMNVIVTSLQSLSKKNTKSLQSNNIRSHVQKHINDLKKLPSDVVLEELLGTANVIFCTLASARCSVIKKTAPIDDLIVDEAAAATEPELYIPFHLKPKRLLAVGDPDQLPATVISRRANAMGYAKSLHERLMHDCKYDHIMLDVQYRMHPEISSFPSSKFYQNKIQNGENVMNSKYAKGALLLDRKPYTFLQVEGKEEQLMGGSYCNRTEATIIVDLISNLQRIAAGTASRTKDGQPWYGSDRVRVITFYSAQVSCIQKCLEDRGLGNTVVVATVDSSQGCEADIVLISFVRSQGDKNDDWTTTPSSSMMQCRNFGAGFLTDDRRMNVALTRAKYQLICVGNVRAFPQMHNAATLHQLAMNVADREMINDNYSTVLHRQPPKKLLQSFSYT